MTIRTRVLCALLAALVASCVRMGGTQVPKSRIAIRIVDDEGRPLSGVHVLMPHYTPPPSVEGLTDSNGVFQLRDHILGGLSCQTAKVGYYDTCGELWSGPSEGYLFPPTNRFTLVLTKIVDPVPMIRRRAWVVMPTLGVPIAYDLEVGELLPPFGKGLHPDVWLLGRMRFASTRDFDFSLVVSFSNSLDGVMGFVQPRMSMTHFPASALIPPQLAPLAGYSNVLVLARSQRPQQPFVESRREDRNYVFRIRTETNDVGEIIQALHGWIKGDIGIGESENPQLFLAAFTYELNTNAQSRSLEAEQPKM